MSSEGLSGDSVDQLLLFDFDLRTTRAKSRKILNLNIRKNLQFVHKHEIHRQYPAARCKHGPGKQNNNESFLFTRMVVPPLQIADDSN